ncbi:endoribonuclease l-psp, partial [Nannochloropsis gaditana CCMP526]|uniref:endoribonuclease l-psp n=1 Tax=Nannochloropsis gaditana (strain CCMP526) TaxID=1093141 RepID=UPI00029F60AD
MVQIEARLAQLGIDLPDVIAPKAGHIPLLKNGVLMTGKVGADKSLEEGQEAAQVIAINLLATLKSELGDLDK